MAPVLNGVSPHCDGTASSLDFVDRRSAGFFDPSRRPVSVTAVITTLSVACSHLSLLPCVCDSEAAGTGFQAVVPATSGRVVGQGSERSGHARWPMKRAAPAGGSSRSRSIVVSAFARSIHSGEHQRHDAVRHPTGFRRVSVHVASSLYPLVRFPWTTNAVAPVRSGRPGSPSVAKARRTVKALCDRPYRWRR